MNKSARNKDIARMLEALGAGSRLEILYLLRGRALCVTAIAKKLAISQGAVSQHLRILKEAHLVIAERRGYYVHYRINEEVFSRISAFAKSFTVSKRGKCTSSDCERR
jgi:DNA-binding transcriptional ArsR family regulator